MGSGMAFIPMDNLRIGDSPGVGLTGTAFVSGSAAWLVPRRKSGETDQGGNEPVGVVKSERGQIFPTISLSLFLPTPIKNEISKLEKIPVLAVLRRPFDPKVVLAMVKTESARFNNSGGFGQSN